MFLEILRFLLPGLRLMQNETNELNNADDNDSERRWAKFHFILDSLFHHRRNNFAISLNVSINNPFVISYDLLKFMSIQMSIIVDIIFLDNYFGDCFGVVSKFIPICLQEIS